jgi:hypothetical protein
MVEVVLLSQGDIASTFGDTGYSNILASADEDVCEAALGLAVVRAEKVYWPASSARPRLRRPGCAI